MQCKDRKVPRVLLYIQDPLDRRLKFNQFIEHLQPILRCYQHVAEFLDEYPDCFVLPDSALRNMALYQLLFVYTDQEGKDVISQFHGDQDGHKAFMALQDCCAQINPVDKHRFDAELQNVKHRNGETATHYIARF